MTVQAPATKVTYRHPAAQKFCEDIDHPCALVPSGGRLVEIISIQPPHGFAIPGWLDGRSRIIIVYKDLDDGTLYKIIHDNSREAMNSISSCVRYVNLELVSAMLYEVGRR